MPQAPSVRGPLNSAELDQFVSHIPVLLLQGVGFSVFLTEVRLLICFELYAADANNAQLSYMATYTVQSTSYGPISCTI